MPTKAAPASASSSRVFSARLPMRISASTTITSTAALMPNSAPSIHGDAAPERVEQAQAQHHQRARQHEQDAGHEPAAHAVQRPADVGGELLRLRARQQHAEIERVQEARLVDPLLLVDQHAVHHGDLPGRPAEIDAADLQPDRKASPKLGEPPRSASSRLFALSSHAAFAGQLCRSSAACRDQASSAS